MKNFYIIALITGASFVADAQIVTNDFESFTLAPESYDNGSSGAGGFDETDAFYENNYDVTWGSWTGFSISNVTDNTTSGWGNQYSAFPGSGYNSSNYAVYYSNGSINFQGAGMAANLDSVKITNSTYAAIAMRDGDAYSKQFGSPLNANGDPDGTNGEDYFRIWIIGEYVGGSKDSIEFYLADYRFADPLQDYIVDEWVNVDLSSFTQPVTSLSFRFESSDNGQWGMNTPAYFALDDLSFTSVSSIEEKEIEFLAYPNPFVSWINVKGGRGTLEIRDVEGKTVMIKDHFENSIIEMNEFSAGVYFITLNSDAGRSTLKLIK